MAKQTEETSNAGDTTTQNTSPKTAKIGDALTKVGKALLKDYPELSAVYVTSDGAGFSDKTDADYHAARLSDAEIITVER